MDIISQEELIKRLEEENGKSEFFIKKPTNAIIVTEQNVDILSKKIKINPTNNELQIGTIDSATYENKKKIYIDENGKYKIGIAIIFQLVDEELDIYPNAEFQDKYTELKGVKQNIPKEIREKAQELTKYFRVFTKGQNEKVEMIPSYILNRNGEEGIIEAPWGGTQEYKKGAYFVIERGERGEIKKTYVINADKNGNPINYIKAPRKKKKKKIKLKI